MITPDIAAKAFLEIARETDVDTAVSGLMKTLEARGARSLLPRIVTSLERMQTQASARAVHITVAKKSDAPHAQSIAEKEFGEQGSVSVDDSLIGGYVITKGGEQLDASYKSALVRLYHSFIH